MTTWSKEPPTEPGWYWCRYPSLVRGWQEPFPYMHTIGETVFDPRAEFGPAIPSPKAIEAAQDALRWYEDQSFALIGNGAEGAGMALMLDEGKRARAAIAKLEARP